MDKFTNIIIICAFTLLIAGGIYYISSKNMPNTKQGQNQADLLARREDLLATQQVIQQQIIAINQTLQLTIQQQQELINAINNISTQMPGIANTIQDLNLTLAPLPVINTPPAPQPSAPTPAPIPVTRAS